MQIKTTPIRMTTIKTTEITSVGEDIETWEPLCTVDGIVNSCSHYVEHYGGSSKT